MSADSWRALVPTGLALDHGPGVCGSRRQGLKRQRPPLADGFPGERLGHQPGPAAHAPALVGVQAPAADGLDQLLHVAGFDDDAGLVFFGERPARAHGGDDAGQAL